MLQSRTCDFLIRLKNSYAAGRPTMIAPSSNVCEAIAELLQKHNLIESYSTSEDPLKNITLNLIYHDQRPQITNIRLFSKPGRRLYNKASSLPWGASKNSIFIISTSKGLMSQKQARSQKVGGELLAEIY
jgi:small subunit ribosomal protein S8